MSDNVNNTAGLLSLDALTGMMFIPAEILGLTVPVVTRDLLVAVVKTGANLVAECDALLGKNILPDLSTFQTWRVKTVKAATQSYMAVGKNDWDKKLTALSGVRGNQMRGLTQDEYRTFIAVISNWGRRYVKGAAKTSGVKVSAAKMVGATLDTLMTPDLAQMLSAAGGGVIGRQITATVLSGGKLAIKLTDGGKSGALLYDVAKGQSEVYGKLPDYNSDVKSAAVSGRLRRLVRENGLSTAKNASDRAFITANKAAYDKMYADSKKLAAAPVVTAAALPDVADAALSS